MSTTFEMLHSFSVISWSLQMSKPCTRIENKRQNPRVKIRKWLKTRSWEIFVIEERILMDDIASSVIWPPLQSTLVNEAAHNSSTWVCINWPRVVKVQSDNMFSILLLWHVRTLLCCDVMLSFERFERKRIRNSFLIFIEAQITGCRAWEM